MKREEFLSKLGLGLLVACAGCNLLSCSSSKMDDPQPAPDTGILLTADLTSSLLNVGDSKSAKGVMLVRIATGNTANSFTAVQSSCTHQGTSIDYNVAQAKFICPNHGSQFSHTGQVLMGPAVISLQKYTVSINGIIATVTV